jgi:integrase
MKQFLLWLIENGYNTIPEKKIERIKLPPRNTITKKAADLLTPDEIQSIVKACKKSKDRAMILLLYEGGFRIGEIATLTWGDIEFVSGGTSVSVLFKTKYYRHVRVVMATEYLKVWKADYPGEPTREALVFLNGLGGAYTHSTISRRIARIVQSAGIERHVTPHIFRHSRITHLIKEGMQESAIKMMMWGQPDTRMWKTYVHLTGQDIDAEVARMYGIVDKKDDDLDKGVTPKQCTNCSTINPPTAFTCYTCGQPLDSTGALKLEEMARFIVEHGDSLQEYIASFVSKKAGQT